MMTIDDLEVRELPTTRLNQMLRCSPAAAAYRRTGHFLPGPWLMRALSRVTRGEVRARALALRRRAPST
jgi:hypothetical protein